MTLLTLDRLRRLTLCVAVLVLTPIGLSYLVDPAQLLPRLMDVAVRSVDEANTMRSVGAMVLAFVGLFGAGLARAPLRVPALLALFTFTAGLALGRSVSLALDGWPSPLPMLYLTLEVSTALTVAVLLAVKSRP